MTTATLPAAPWRTAKPSPVPAPAPKVPAEPAPAELLELVTAPDNEATMPRADAAAAFAAHQSKVEALDLTANTIRVTCITDLAGQKMARAARLSYRAIRLEVDKKREEMVEGMTREVKRINSNAKKVRDHCEKQEALLLDQEQFIERETTRLENERRTGRANEIRPFLTSFPSVDLGRISEEDYQAMLADAKELHSLKLERERKAEEARLAAEAEAAAERERQRLENIRLREEAAAREEAARIEREAAAARQRAIEEQAAEDRREAAEVLRQEREARLKIERQRAEAEAAEEQRREQAAEAERQRIAAEAEAARKAAAAPDREKLTAYADALAELPLPRLSGEAGHIADWLNSKVRLLTEHIRKAAAEL